MLRRVDAYILSLFELVSHCMQRNFGIKSIQLSRFSHSLAFVCVGKLVTQEHGFGRGIDIALFVLYTVIILETFLNPEDGNKHSEGEAIAHNPYKLTMYWDRILWLFMLCSSIPKDILESRNFWTEFAYMGMMFRCCDDLPPGISKLTKFWHSVRALLKPVSNPV
jgi:hypothetical protein